MSVELIQALRTKTLIGDGANGTFLAHLGYKRLPYDLANIHAPELVLKAHQAYLDAGANIIETNTFMANRLRLEDCASQVVEINLAGARLAKEAAINGQFVLGSIGPSGKHLEPIGSITPEEIYDSVREQAKALAEGGVDGFILETFISLEELKISAEAVRSVSDLPMIACKAFIEDGEALTEGLPTRCAEQMSQMGFVAVGANCIVGPQRMLDVVRQFTEGTDLPIVAMPTPGMPQLVKGEVCYDATPEYFAKAAARLIEEGASFVGGCCGTTPEHVRALSEFAKAGLKRKTPQAFLKSNGREEKPLQASEPTELSQKLGKKFVVTVELDLPRGLSVEKVLHSARSLKIRGADLIDISDGARARLRMNPLSISTLIQNQIGIEVMMHFSCRDRNLLAVQADLLGSHALGVRNILAITGDPATIGDYPSATSVFDVDSIGLVRILSRFNEGIDLAGYSVGMRCAFTIGVAFNPASHEPEAERDRLRRKADAGAHLIYTQPLFEPRLIEKAAEECHKLKLPLFVGIMPLRSARHAEFMHNEVPGILIPDWLRTQMAQATDEECALEIGIDEARKLSQKTKECAQGLYLMPPFGNHKIAENVMEAVI